MGSMDHQKLSALTLPADLDAELRRELEANGRPVRLAADQTFLEEGGAVDHFAMVGSGSLRVFKSSPEGRAITLYHVVPGECCMVNVLCLLSDRRSPATAVAEVDSDALIYPAQDFRRWIADRVAMRRFVFAMLADRVAAMMTQIEEVAFRRMDQRLAAYLMNRSHPDGSGILAVTHEAIASDLGTAREVVSRLLKSFEQAGALRLGRGEIEVTDPGLLGGLVE